MFLFNALHNMCVGYLLVFYYSFCHIIIVVMDCFEYISNALTGIWIQSILDVFTTVKPLHCTNVYILQKLISWIFCQAKSILFFAEM